MEVNQTKEVNLSTRQVSIHWQLKTTHPVLLVEQALQVIRYDCWHWWIEQLFATLKLAGLNIEATQLELNEAIQKMTILTLSVTGRTLQQMMGSRGNLDIDAPFIFRKEQEECLIGIAPALRGQTKKQQNIYPLYSLLCATCYIAHLGGWAGFCFQSPPDMCNSSSRVCNDFETILIGWQTTLAALIHSTHLLRARTV
jgi:hypothetical protein